MKLILRIFFITLIASLTSLPFLCAEVVVRNTQGSNYYLFIPSKYSPQEKYPLIIALHWSTGRGTDMIERWQEPAEKLGYIVACPNSQNSAYWGIETEDKVILKMIDEVIKDYSIDQKRIFVTGFSSGGTYTLYLGLTYPDIFSAIAPFAGNLKWLIKEAGVKPGKVKKQIPVCFIHGTNDITIPIKESYFGQQELLKYGFKAFIKEIPNLDHQYPAYVTWLIIKWLDRQSKE